MQVVAKQMGYINHKRIKEGEAFTLEDIPYKGPRGEKLVHKAADQFSPKWMKKEGEEDAPEAKLGKNEVNIPGYRPAGKAAKIKAKNLVPQD
jgi:hypothetical protein